MMRDIVFAAAVSVALAACGDAQENSKPASQVAARVNGEEISVHQINFVLARAGRVPEERARQAGPEVLERLIDQELLVQQALEKKLERDPKVLQALEASRREILARAYLEQIAGSVAKPDADAVKQFYEQNPALFRERRIYNLQELVIAAKPEQRAMVEEQLAAAKSMNELAVWLKENNIPASGNVGVKAAEQLPLELLPRVASLKDGQTTVVPSSAGFTVVHVASSQVRPMDEQAALPFIEQYLTRQRQTELANAEVKQLRAKAAIEYVGDFAQGAGASAATAGKQTEKSPSAARTDSHMEKGLSGLK